MGAQQLLQAGKLEEALEAAKRELVDDPDDIDSLYCKAVSQRYLGQPKDALRTLKQLKAVNPNYARAWQEEGHNQKALGDLDTARDAYQHAVGLNRALVASWRELAAIHKQRGNQKEHAITKGEFERLSKLPPELVTVTSLIEENKLYKAEKLCRDFLQKTPHHIEAMRLLAALPRFPAKDAASYRGDAATCTTRHETSCL
jgi:tetratricopeptide (TPR) repeat protein